MVDRAEALTLVDWPRVEAGADWWNPVLAEPLRIVNGEADTRGVIGSGVGWKTGT